MTTLYHKRCGGTISVDLAGSFVLKTHSISIQPDGISLGVLELAPKRGRAAASSLICEKCGDEFSQEEAVEVVESNCLTCRTKKSVDNLWCSHQFPCVCGECKDALQGKSKKPLNDTMKELLRYFDISGSDIRFVSFIDLLKKPLD